MPAYKYRAESETGNERVIVETGFDAGQFGELELFGTLMQFRDLKKPYWWNIDVGGSIPGPVLCHEGMAYFGACDKNFYALDVSTGKEIWRFATEGVIAHGCCIAGDAVFFGSYDHNLYALDKGTGELRWKFKTNDIIATKPAAYEGVVYLGAMDGNMYAIDAKTGGLLWKYSTNGMLYTPLVADGKVFTGLNNFFAIDMNGRLVWRFNRNKEIMAFPAAYSKGTLFFGCFDSNFYALDGESGRIRWTFKAGDVTYTGHVWNGMVYFGSRDYNVYCLDEDDGSLMWRFRTNGFVILPLVHNRLLYFGSYDNNVYALNPETGDQVWSFKTNGAVNYVCGCGDRLLFGSWDCNLYCVDAKTGKLIWKFRTSMSTQSMIAPPDTSIARTAEIRWIQELEDEKKRYKSEGGTGDYGINISQYGAMDAGYTGQKRKGYVK